MLFLPRIDANGFLDTVGNAPLIAFQAVQYGWAVAAPQNFAFYAPMSHPGGGNLNPEETFTDRLGYAFINRMSKPALRTLRPTAKPTPTHMLTAALASYGGPDPMANFDKLPGDNPIIVDFQTQVVIQAIEEHGRPELQQTMSTLKIDMMSEALDLVIQHAAAAREFCEVGTETKPALIRLYLMQSVQAMKTALEMLLKP